MLIVHGSRRQTHKKQEYPSVDTFFFHDSMASNESLSTVEKASTQA